MGALSVIDYYQSRYIGDKTYRDKRQYLSTEVGCLSKAWSVRGIPPLLSGGFPYFNIFIPEIDFFGQIYEIEKAIKKLKNDRKK